MSNIFISHHNDGYRKSTKVTDLLNMETIVYTDDNDDYDEIKQQVIQYDARGAEFNEYIELFYKVDEKAAQEEEINSLREELGIVLNDDNSVTLPNGVVLPDGIASIFEEVTDREHFEHLMLFAEQLMENPYDHAREALVDWIMCNPSLSILPDGRIKGYRAVNENFMSYRAGYGIVNGVEYECDHLDNTPGNIIEFPSFMIDHNPNHTCSVGIHVGTKAYADSYVGFNGHKLNVAFSARDVVSPPSDAQQEKIRVCRVEILDEIVEG